MTELRPGTPAEAGLAADAVAGIVPALEAFLPGGREPEPAYPGFVVLAARHGVVVEHAARGSAVRHGGARVPMRTDTVFDLASLSKLYTAVVAVALAERGALDLDAPVARHLPGFPAGVTARRLLTHTAGLPPVIDLAPFPDGAARLAAIARQPLTEGYAYSDLGLIALGALCEAAGGRDLAALVAGLVTGPLGLTDTRYRPPAALLPRVAATEEQPWTGRPLVHGTVHDENAYALGGVAGHAGVFATAWDVAVLAQTMLNGGSYGGRRVLAAASVREMLTDHNAHLGPGAARGLGWQLDQPDWMGDLASPTAFGHTGFTGTSVVADRATGTLLVLLTNRVHPTRHRGTGHAWRRAAARALARAAAEA
ncbi:serine hydrolase domain-containing protein [Streptomyces sp. RFCAC02]|uniref:serine hydrolase domain-containing protein n=1 Tax=Streptomyces sp. RFCAC02 TaxID=2499143 RepID=UPI0010221357|nr:serine hydrolase domain-containing protein [Streptomyces sp. RFCAC02]